MKYDLITILGCTATGKTKLAIQLADCFNGEIISADSRQVYRGMNIGTGKDLSEYFINQKQIPYHLIDVKDPSEEFNLFEFKELFQKVFQSIVENHNKPFLVGGTGLYLSSILQDYNLSKADFESAKSILSSLSDDELRAMLKDQNPGLHNTTDLTERDRIIKAIAISKSSNKKQFSHFKPDLACRQPGSSGGKSVTTNDADFSVSSFLRNDREEKISSLNIGIKLPRDEIKKRITERLKKRLNEGMIEEVKSLMDSGISYDKMIFFGLEYKFIAQYLIGELNKNDMFQKLNSAIHSFAKRQMTWFRKMERESIVINWIDGPDFNKAKELIKQNFIY